MDGLALGFGLEAKRKNINIKKLIFTTTGQGIMMQVLEGLSARIRLAFKVM